MHDSMKGFGIWKDDIEVRINISPQLGIDWGHKSLTEENLANTRFVFDYLLKDIRTYSTKERSYRELPYWACLAK